jgi:hypothetical protein
MMVAVGQRKDSSSSNTVLALQAIQLLLQSLKASGLAMPPLSVCSHCCSRLLHRDDSIVMVAVATAQLQQHRAKFDGFRPGCATFGRLQSLLQQAGSSSSSIVLALQGSQQAAAQCWQQQRQHSDGSSRAEQ